MNNTNEILKNHKEQEKIRQELQKKKIAEENKKFEEFIKAIKKYITNRCVLSIFYL